MRLKTRPRSITIFLSALFFIMCLNVSNPGFCESEKNPQLTPMADILDIIRNSGYFDFHETFLDPKSLLEDYQQSLTEPDENQFLRIEGNKRSITIYLPSDDIAERIQRANQLKNKNEAEKILNEVLLMDPRYTLTHVYLAEIKMDRREYRPALDLLSDAVKINPANYKAYYLKSQCEKALDNSHDRRESLIMTVIANRNHTEAWNELIQMGKKKGFSVYNKPFVPAYTTEKMDNGKIRIYLDKDRIVRWMPYAFNKTVWRYYPDYFQKKTGLDKYELTVDEEYECLSNMIWSYDAFQKRGNYEKDLMVERIKRIKDRFYIKEFILFEIMGPRRTDVLAAVDEKHLLDLKDYINEFVILSEQDND